MCGDLRSDHIGDEVVLLGWVKTRRDHGGAVFVDLRDRTGYTQVVFDASTHAQAHAIADQLRSEWVIGVVGRVRSRGDNVNDKIPTGAIEVIATYIQVFNKSETPPFELDDDVNTAEEKRLEHRYLDLRRAPMQRNLLMRSQLNHVTRKTLVELGFIELETPYMVKYTPGGARNFLVPCRLSPGTFYALAESPQLFKQLFMISGFDRYFQIVKCFRDEDLRQDRQPEFTQIDLEMSFASETDVQRVMEAVIKALFREVLKVELPAQFPVMTYAEAMARYGSDKPDLRFGLEHTMLTEIGRKHAGGAIPFFKDALDQGGILKAMRVPAAHDLSREATKRLEAEAKGVGAGGLASAKVEEGGTWKSPLTKWATDAFRTEVNTACGAQPGDWIFFQAAPAKIAHTVLNHLRLLLGRQFGLIKEKDWKVLWVTEFPLFEHDEKTKSYVAAHHPFTSPRPEDVDKLLTDPASCRARAYDLVLNGNEIAGGSVRIHSPEVQAKVFEALSITPEQQRAKFGFLLDALSYGAPPHAGIAAGMDRVAMLIAGAGSLRDVVPFPKTQKGTDLMSGAPTVIDEKQLADIYVKSIPPPA
jgi:aspartyl-tRNA synthetase